MENGSVSTNRTSGSFLGILEWTSNLVESITKVACVISMSAMTIIVFAQVIFRFVFNNALPWPEEASRYLMIWTCFLGSSLAVKYGEHIGVLFIIQKVPMKVRKYILLFVKLSVIVFLAFAAYHGFNMLNFAKMQISPASRINMALAYGAIPTGCAFGLLHAIVNLFKKPRESDIALSI